METLGVLRRRGFTLIELISVIVVLAVLAVVAIPKFYDHSSRARESACKGILGSVRTGIANFYADAALDGTGAYPTLTELTTLGTVLQDEIPSNPFNNDANVSVVTWTSNQPATGNHGWNYDPATGRFWANSDTSGVNENEW